MLFLSIGQFSPNLFLNQFYHIKLFSFSVFHILRLVCVLQMEFYVWGRQLERCISIMCCDIPEALTTSSVLSKKKCVSFDPQIFD